jgi:amino acid transporter
MSEPPASTDRLPDAPVGKLVSGRLGVPSVVFLVVAGVAPLSAVTGTVPLAIAVGSGAGAPGAYVAVGLILLVFTSGYAALSRVVMNTGAFFAYVGRGMGLTAGTGAAALSVLAYVATQLGLYGFFGGLLAGQLNAVAGLSVPWWGCSLLAWLVVLGLSVLSVDVGARVLGVLMVGEVGGLVLVALAVVVHGGGADGLGVAAAFAPGNVLTGGFTGSAGIAFACAFSSFIGFEASAIYGEESRDPGRTVPSATYAAVVVITAVFAGSSWAIVSGVGVRDAVAQVGALSSVAGVALADPAAVLFHVATAFVGGWLASVMRWLVVSSLFAGLLAFQNCTARYLFSLGRAGVLPSLLQHANRYGAPARGSLATSGITVVVMVAFALARLDPVLNLLYWSAGVAVIAIVVVEVLVCVAVVAYFRRSGSEGHWWSTLAAPVLAGLGLLAGLYLLISRFGLLAGTAPAGVDPTTTAWVLNPVGWALVALPFVVLLVGGLRGRALSYGRDHDQSRADILT